MSGQKQSESPTTGSNSSSQSNAKEDNDSQISDLGVITRTWPGIPREINADDYIFRQYAEGDDVGEIVRYEGPRPEAPCYQAVIKWDDVEIAEFEAFQKEMNEICARIAEGHEAVSKLWLPAEEVAAAQLEEEAEVWGIWIEDTTGKRQGYPCWWNGGGALAKKSAEDIAAERGRAFPDLKYTVHLYSSGPQKVESNGAKCSRCGEFNEYQSGPFTCFSCRSHG